MNKQTLEKMLAVEDMIASFQSRIFETAKWMQEFGNMFPELAKKANDEIDTFRACITRLKSYYNNLTLLIKRL